MAIRHTCDCDVIHEDIVKDVRSRLEKREKYIALATLYKMFGDPTRIQILHALEQHEMCVCDIAVLLNITKSAVSHQLKELRLLNLVKYRKDGQMVFYSLADDHVRSIIDLGLEHINE